MKFLLRFILNGVALWLVSYFYAPLVIQGDTQAILTAFAIFAIANTIIKPILNVIAIPLKVITLGLASIFLTVLINIGLFWYADKFATAVNISGGRKELIIAALIYGVITWIIQKVL